MPAETYKVNMFESAQELEVYLNSMPPNEAVMEIMETTSNYTLVTVVCSGLEPGEES